MPHGGALRLPGGTVRGPHAINRRMQSKCGIESLATHSALLLALSFSSHSHAAR